MIEVSSREMVSLKGEHLFDHFNSQSSDLHLILTNRDGKILKVNKNYVTLSGFGPQELLGKPFEPNLFQKIDTGTLSSGTPEKPFLAPSKRERKLKSKSGRDYWIDTLVSPVFGEREGFVESMLLLGTDVTAKKQSDMAHESALELSCIGRWSYCMKSNKHNWSWQMRIIFGVEDTEDLNTSSIFRKYADESKVTILEAIKRSSEDGIGIKEELKLTTREGKVQWIKLTCYPEKDQNGKVARLSGTVYDVTEKNSFSEKLDKSVAHFRQFFEQSEEPTLILKAPEWVFTFCNQASLELFEVPNLEAFLTIGPWDLSPELQPDGSLSGDAALKYIMEALETGQKTFEWVHQTLGGKEIPCRVTLTRFADNGEYFLRALVTNRSENVALEKAVLLKNSELEAAQAMNRMASWTYLTDKETLNCSSPILSVLPLDPKSKSITVKDFADVLHMDDSRSFLEHFKKCLEETKSIELLLRTHRFAQPSITVWLETKIESYKSSSGEISHVTGIFQDVTEKINQEKERAFILQSTKMGVWKYFTKEKRFAWDPSMFSLYGLAPSRKGLSLDEWKETMPLESQKSALLDFEESLLGEKIYESQFQIITPSGEKKDLGARGAPEHDDNGKLTSILGVSWDRSKEQAALDESYLQKQVAQHSSKLAAIGELAAGVGHEINNPLAIIRGYLYSLQDVSKSLDTELHVKASSSIDRIEIAIDRIAAIVKGLTTFARTDTNESSYFDIRDVLMETIQLISEIYKKDGIEIDVRFPQGTTRLLICGDRGKLQQIYMNLLSNARDALLEQPKKVLQLELCADKESVEFAVRDNGDGIEDDVKKQIFHPFFTTKDVHKGTGIGLSMSHKFVEEMGGQISVHSEAGSGAEFKVKLPLAKNIPKPEDTDLELTERDIKALGKTNKNYRILLVDDEEEIRFILKNIIEDIGHSVEEAVDGQDAYEKYSKDPAHFDIIITDMKMPRLGGLGLVQKIRQGPSTNRTKIIAVTGGVNANFDSPDSEISTFVDGHFLKPFTYSQVEDAIAGCFPLQ